MGQQDHRELRQRHVGDGRETGVGPDSRSSRLGLGLPPLDRQGPTDATNGLDLYYNTRTSQQQQQDRHHQDQHWGYQPPPPVITEQPKPGSGGQQHFQPYERSYPNTLESLAEKVHSFGTTPRRMSAGAPTQSMTTRISSQQSPSSHYYVQHMSTGGRRIMPRSGSDQHLPQTEYSDYTSITQAGRHSLLRSSLKSGSTLSRYNQRYVDQAAVAAQLAQAKYGTTGSRYDTTGTLRRNRGSLDYSSDTEATSGSRSGYYYYRSQGAAAVPHSTIPTLGRQNALAATDISTKFNSLPRDRGTSRLAMNKRFGDRSVSLLQQDESDGALSAPEMPSIRRDRGGRLQPSSSSVFSSDEYRQWLSRTPSTSAIYEQIRASRDVLNQQRAARFTYSAENIHDALKNMESGLYSSYGRPGTTTTLDRHFTRSQQPSIPARSLSTQHITTSALSSSRSPSMRRMRQLLDLDSVRAGAPSPVPTPSGTLPRGQRQLDINPAEFLKYKIDKPGMVGGSSITGLPQLTAGPGSLVSAADEPVSGMLWIHLLAGRGLRASTGTSAATTPVTPSGTSPSITGSTGLRDLYCVLECDRVHKARTVVRTGELVFDWDESFELDLVNNRELDLLIYSWDPQYRHKLCYKGSVYLPTLLKSGPIHQLALKIEPRGTLYLRLRHSDSFTLYRRKPATLSLTRASPLFGVDLETVVNRENKTGGVPGGVPTGLVGGAQQNIPIIVKRCVEEVERRGLDIIGLYRLCGSATKKRILREAFERNSRSVDLSPDNVPDINVITGVLKDYLRELPEPLFTKCLYQMMVDALAVCLPDDPEGNAKLMFSILDCLPRINRATLMFLMDHLALVVSASDRNKMSAQNLATALAPPLMLHSMDAPTTPTASGKADLDYQQPIGVLRYLLQIWPTPKHHSDRSSRQATRAAWRQSQCVSSRSLGDGSGSASASVAGAPPSLAQRAEPSLRSQAPFPPHPRSAASAQRGPQPLGPSHLILDQSSASKGLYRPLSPRVGPPTQQGSAASSVGGSGVAQGGPGSPVAPLRPRQVIVSSPGSPSSSSDSQSGSESVKHCLPSRVSSPMSSIRGSPSSQALRSSPASATASAVAPPGVRRSPVRHSPVRVSMASSPASSGPRSSPSVTSLTSVLRASPSMHQQSPGSRSSSPAMQSTSAGLNVTMGGATPSFSPLATSSGPPAPPTSWHPTSSAPAPGWQPTYTRPTYASTNPFLTGAYMSYTPGGGGANSGGGGAGGEDKFNTIGSTKEVKSFFESYAATVEASRYSTMNSKSTSNYNNEADTNGKVSFLSTGFTMDSKYSPKNSYDTSPNITTVSNSSSTGLLNVEETPTPTSSIETEDSATREVGEKDVEGDGEQSD